MVYGARRWIDQLWDHEGTGRGRTTLELDLKAWRSRVGIILDPFGRVGFLVIKFSSQQQVTYTRPNSL